MNRNLLLLLVLLLLGGLRASAQRSLVDESDENINNIPRKGQRVSIQQDAKRVELAWTKQLTEQFAGKFKNSKTSMSLTGVTIADISPTPINVLSIVRSTPSGTYVWWSIDLGNAYLGQAATPTQWKAAEKYLKEFARSMYREDLVAQIADADRLLLQAQNSHNATIAKLDAVKKDIDKNKAKKLEIQQLLAANAADLQRLNNLVDDNLKEQEAARANIVTAKLALEAVKERLSKIE